ncbi:phosphate regulon transcriptional regulator PhoB [Thiohalobacter thiocyanaticus]|uniref:Phosphate regulon transcriptional regulatory protein PhoB n=1 Tax=Thiohalobacter thiocyanaticus TaxID=585455 RepID=A0A426QHU8_9GAMM|nr:phosphate regulon transcriptional regulator PhoB [Thiohalobacter thiocyanaticus]RRQ21286.1 phosphate regulon transcriptional regulatory protein PhoB [Thiohalobacter thiocyanaticus]
MSQRILIVEDEPAIREMVAFALERAGFQYTEAETAGAAQVSIADEQPDLILLDWMLPDLSGVDLARRIKQEELSATIPIIMLTARGEEEDKIRGLDAGADDYVTKPFSPRELVARIKAVLRRAHGEATDELLEVEGLVLDPAGHRVSVGGQALEMGPTEFRLLHFFMSHPERVFSRSRLLDSVWGRNVYVEERTVDVHIRRLRKALSAHGHDRLIQTVRGAGYRFSTRV